MKVTKPTSDRLRVEYRVYPRGSYIQLDPKLMLGSEDISDKLLKSYIHQEYTFAVDEGTDAVLICETRRPTKVELRIPCTNYEDAMKVIDIIKDYGWASSVCLDPADFKWIDATRKSWCWTKSSLTRLEDDLHERTHYSLAARIKRLFAKKV